MLHSTFWHHGAGDLDLPPWAVSMAPMPTDLPLRHDDAQGLRTKGGKSQTGKASLSTPLDGVFLDFLYPPQALAWLHGANGQLWERWERRNAKRLPEGFVQTSRGYASRAYAQPDLAEVDRPQEQGYRRGSATKRLGIQEDQAQDLVHALRATQSANEERKSEARQGGSAQAHETTIADVLGGAFADSPGDLAEAASDSMQQLRNIMSSSRQSLTRVGNEKKAELAERVLHIYDSMDQNSKNDARLKVELLDWLSVYPTNDAEVRCAQLYHSIHVHDRTLSVYQAALTVFLRRGRHVQAFNLHREALRNIANGDQVTKAFFRYAVDQHRWQLAMNIEAQYELSMEKMERGSRKDMFWFHVSEIPELLPKAIALSQYLRALTHAQTTNDQVRRFSARFFKEALIQESDAPGPAKTKVSMAPQGGLSLPKQSVGQLFKHLHDLPEASKFFEHIVLSMIGPNTRYPYPQIHRIVSYVYVELRKRVNTSYRLPEALLMTLLERLTRFWATLEKQRESHHSTTVADVVRGWKRDHGKLSEEAVMHLLSWHASSGRVDRFEAWLAYLKEHYPTYEALKKVLGSTIYIHARRADLTKAKLAFDIAVKLTLEHDEIPPLICWNVLLHAYSRTDDLEGALEILQALIDKGLKPDEYSFHPVMEMLAKRGDVEGVKDMLSQYDNLAQKRREAAFFGSLLTALVNCGEVEEAEAVLKTAIDEVKTGKVRGSLTGSFNIVLTAHALRRNVDATMRTYRWMKAEGIRMDSETFAALIQSLTAYRQTPAAWKILRDVMTEHGARPTAFHYALVMTGYVNQGKYAEALEVHEHMRSLNIKATFSSNAIFLKAKASKEGRDSRRLAFGSVRKARAEPLHETIKELQGMMQASHGNDLAAKQPQAGLGEQEGTSAVPAAYFNFLIYIHGKRRCFDAVQELYRQFKEVAKKAGGPDAQAPVQLLAALMMAHLRAGEYDDVERCWILAKEQADEFAAVVPVPKLQPASSAQRKRAADRDIMDLQPPLSDDAQEAGFQMKERTDSTNVKRAILADQTPVPPTRQRSPGLRYILTRPLRFYLYALAAQHRFQDTLSLVSRLFTQGYTFDNRTWNVFIQLLCQCSPPLTLLAFTLTERFLIPHFPGWAPVSKSYKPNLSARQEGLEYIRARYLRPGQLMPQYRTLVVLGSALLKLRSVEASGRRGLLKSDSLKGMERYVGTPRQVRSQAPKTLFAVQSMPTVDDALQNRLLRRS